MIRIAICDDEPIALQMLSERITRALAGQELSVSCFSSGSALRESLLSNHSFDVLFLDINMPDVNGIYLARHIRPLLGDALLIFVSSQDDAVFDSFAAEPFRFLRKSRLDAELPQLSRDLLVKLQERGEQHLSLRYRKSFIRVDPLRILYLESKGKVQEIHLFEQLIEVNYRMKELEALLEPYGFLKPHNSFLVNYRFISSIRPTELVLDGGIRLPVSKHRLKETKEQYLNLISEL